MAPAQFRALSLLLIFVRTTVIANRRTMWVGAEDGQGDSKLFLKNDVEEKLTRFAGIIWAANDRVNLVSRKSNNVPEDIRNQHIQDCLPLVSTMKNIFGSLVKHDSKMELSPLKVLDVGSGGGFPALILAISNPDWKVTMLEATGKKCDFLRSTSLTLDLDTRIECARAEDMARKVGWRESFPAVTARAVADLRILAELCLPFVSVGGYMFAMKGPLSAAQVEIDSAEKALRLLGGEVEQVVEVASDKATTLGTRSIVVIRKVSATPMKYPRSVGRPNKRPL
eukprot:jgi/Bigna1/125752/aug1.1_g460